MAAFQWWTSITTTFVSSGTTITILEFPFAYRRAFFTMVASASTGQLMTMSPLLFKWSERNAIRLNLFSVLLRKQSWVNGIWFSPLMFTVLLCGTESPLQVLVTLHTFTVIAIKDNRIIVMSCYVLDVCFSNGIKLHVFWPSYPV